MKGRGAAPGQERGGVAELQSRQSPTSASSDKSKNKLQFSKKLAKSQDKAISRKRSTFLARTTADDKTKSNKTPLFGEFPRHSHWHGLGNLVRSISGGGQACPCKPGAPSPVPASRIIGVKKPTASNWHHSLFCPRKGCCRPSFPSKQRPFLRSRTQVSGGGVGHPQGLRRPRERQRSKA